MQRKIRTMGAGPYGCSYVPVFLNIIQLSNPLLKYANAGGPSDLYAMAHWLKASGLEALSLMWSSIIAISSDLLQFSPDKFSVGGKYVMCWKWKPTVGLITSWF